MQAIGALTLLVRDYDEAIAWYRDRAGFQLISDTDLGGGKRWVLMAPKGATETHLLLAQAVGPEQEAQIGHQAGGRLTVAQHTAQQPVVKFWSPLQVGEPQGET